jgi:DNA-binding CsgD family transcriptional regulator
VATELATEAVLHLRADTDRALTFGEEPVVRAFERLRDDLEPLLKYRKIDVQFVEPPTDGRALPSEVAHGARAVVRGAILGLVDQANVTRVRLQWDCDGKNLLVEVRDDGPGDLTADSVQVQTMRQRILALGGHLSLEATRGWGSQLSVVLPLDPAPLVADRSLIATLSEREVDVMQCVAAGLRNRAVATRLGISENTVKFHLSRIFRKLSISSRAELAGILHGEGIHAPRGVAPQS